jgi:diguanylate cyclase (GGDEF) domain
VEQLRVPLDDGEIYRPTVSIGVALPDDRPVTLTQLLSRADRALYQAKAAGRNRVACWEAATCDTARTEG